MADLLIRDIPDEVLNALREKAVADGMERAPWVREQLIKLAAQPTIKRQYTFRAFGENGTHAMVKRLHDGHVQRGANNCSQAQFDAFRRAALLAERNELGDYEEIYRLLSLNFDEVFPG